MPLFRALILLLIALPASAQVLEHTDYDELELRLSARVDFENYPRQMSPGIPLDGIQSFDGLALGERFDGQAIFQEEGFDRLAGAPASPLRLAAGGDGTNLAVSFYFYLSNQVSGLAPPGYPDNAAGGEGAIAILFDRDQAAFGLRVAAEPLPRNPAPKGRMTVTAFDRAGVLIDVLDMELEWNRAGYGFQMSDRLPRIAGVTLTNRDPAGIAIDDILFDTTEMLSLLSAR